MKKLMLFAAIAVFGLTSVNAQEKGKVRVGLDFGYSAASGGGGVLINLEPKYNISENSNVGLRISAAAFARAVENGGTEVDLDVSTNGAYLGTYDYYFHNGSSGAAPYLGAGLGVYSLAGATLTADLGSGSSVTSPEVGESTEFGGMIRGGVEFGKFRLGVEYNLIPKTELDGGGEFKNSYVGFSLGFYVGGGKWKK